MEKCFMSTHHPSWAGGSPFVDGLHWCIWLCVLLSKSTVAAVSHYITYKAPYNYKWPLTWPLTIILDVIPPPQMGFSSGNCYQLADEPKYCNGTEARGHRFLWPGRIYPNSRQHGVCWVVNSFVHFPKPPENLTCLLGFLWGSQNPQSHRVVE
jgi:hypothetical protein